MSAEAVLWGMRPNASARSGRSHNVVRTLLDCGQDIGIGIVVQVSVGIGLAGMMGLGAAEM